jgi:predicted nucleotidyltransferase
MKSSVLKKALNLAHIKFSLWCMMLTEQDIFRRLEENQSEIKEYGVRRLGLFGSYAKNEQKSRSDIDILVEFEAGMKTFDNYTGLKSLLEDMLSRRVDLVISEALKPQIKPYIMREVKYAKGL